MTRAIRFDPSANDELFEAIDWYDERRSGLGAEFLDSVRRTLDFAVRQPRPGSLVPGIGDDPAVRRVPLARFPYQLVVLASPGELLVIAVMHERRRPGYWSGRLVE